MKNKVFTLPQYLFIKDSAYHYPYQDYFLADFPTWTMTEKSFSGLEHNGWLLSYNRSMQAWFIYHPQVYLSLQVAKTKELAKQLADLFSVQDFDFYFSERGSIVVDGTIKSITTVKEQISESFPDWTTITKYSMEYKCYYHIWTKGE